MKKLILTILTAISIGASGQSLIGIKGGLNLTNISAYNFIHETDARSGFSGGLSFEHFLKANHSMSFELVFSRRGFTHELVFTDSQSDPTGQKATANTIYDYISLPVKTGIYFGQKGIFFGNIGVVPSMLLDAKTMTPTFSSGGVVYPAETIDLTDKINNFDLAGLLEFGANYKASEKVWLTGSLAFQYSFTTITNADYFPNSTIRHYGWTASVGVRYNVSSGD